MKLTGRCYCGAIRYEVVGEPLARIRCHCRECQYGTGGAENLVLIMPREHFRYVAGDPARFTRPDLETPVTREFCAACGTQIATKPPLRPDIVNLKVGTLDDPSVFVGPSLIVWTAEAQPFHGFPEGAAQYPGFPTRRSRSGECADTT